MCVCIFLEAVDNLAIRASEPIVFVRITESVDHRSVATFRTEAEPDHYFFKHFILFCNQIYQYARIWYSSFRICRNWKRLSR